MTIVEKLRNGFLRIFGDIKIFRYPFFFLYHPTGYKVKGDEIRTVINTLKKGDIMIRGYSHYLDGYFIPGFFSHAGLYLGETRRADLTSDDEEKIEKFYEGEQVVVHAMADGVFMEDAINFCRCDYLIILRRSARTEPKLNLDTMFRDVYKKALKHLGKGYDFQFDFSHRGNLSCTELVYVCHEDAMPDYRVRIKDRRVMLIKKSLLIPDDFITKEFDVVFTSRSVKQSTVDKIIQSNED